VEQADSRTAFTFSSRAVARLKSHGIGPEYVERIAWCIDLALTLRDQKDDAPELVQRIRREIDSLGKAVQMAAEHLGSLSPVALQALQRGGLDIELHDATQELKRASALLATRIDDARKMLGGRPGRPRKDWQGFLFNGLAAIWEGATGRDCRGADFRNFVDDVIKLAGLKSELTTDVVDSRLKHARDVLKKVKKRRKTD